MNSGEEGLVRCFVPSVFNQNLEFFTLERDWHYKDTDQFMQRIVVLATLLNCIIASFVWNPCDILF